MIVADGISSDVNTLSIVVKGGDSRSIGFNGPQQFCHAYLLDETDTLKIDTKTVDKKSGGDFLVAINNVLMSDSKYADYSAIRFGDK